jgi:dGTPase
VRNAPPLVAFSDEARREADALKHFLHANMYRHYLVNRMTTKARRIITDLFRAFQDDLGLLPPDYADRARIDPARAIADYIAGMTDRYAMREHRRLFAIEDL